MSNSESSSLPQPWALAKLKEITTKIADGSHNPPAKQTIGIPMLSARNIENDGIVWDDFRLISPEDFALENQRTSVSAGDVLLTIVGTIGRSTVVPPGTRPFALQRSVAVLKPRGATPKFLMFQLQSSEVQSQLDERARGTAQKGVYLKSLAELVLKIAPLEEQERIVAEIETQFTRLDAAVTALKRTQANLKRYRAAVLKAACEGRLVPTEAELARAEGRDYEPADRLLARILHDRRALWEAKQLGKMKAQGKPAGGDRWKEKYREPTPPDTLAIPEVPEGWAVASMDQVTEVDPISWTARDVILIEHL